MSLSTPSDAILLDAPEPEAVSWGAIFAGAIAAFALTIALAALGTGLGLSSISPWPGASVGLTTFAVSGAVWLVVMQWLSSAMGGYLAGRLRVRSTLTDAHEAYFRDTAHGFLAWAVATLVVVVLAGSSIASAISGTASAVGSAANTAMSGATHAATSGAGQSSSTNVPTAYYVDLLFRPAQPATPGAASAPTPTLNPSAGDVAEMRGEATRILTTGMATGTLSAGDKAQLVHLIATDTGMSDAEAQHRVDEVIGQVEAAKVQLQKTADAARKSGLTFALTTALALVIGAFIASVSGALGGRLRDQA